MTASRVAGQGAPRARGPAAERPLAPRARGSATTLALALLRAAPKRPALSGGAIAAVAVLAANSPQRSAAALQLAALALAAGLAPLLVEEPHEADATPTTRARRRIVLATVCLPVLALAWLGLLQLAGGAAVLVTAQLAALVAMAAAAAAISDAGVIVVALGFAAARVFAAERLFPTAPGDAHWSGALVCWSVLAVLGLLAVALASARPGALNHHAAVSRSRGRLRRTRHDRTSPRPARAPVFVLLPEGADRTVRDGVPSALLVEVRRAAAGLAELWPLGRSRYWSIARAGVLPRHDHRRVPRRHRRAAPADLRIGRAPSTCA